MCEQGGVVGQWGEKLRHLGHCEALKACDQEHSGVTVDILCDITKLKK